MRKLYTLLILTFLLSTSYANDTYNLSFVGSMDALQKVKVENLTKGTSVMINPTDVLRLISATGIIIPSANTQQLIVYPNPSYESTAISFDNITSGTVRIFISDLSGKEIYSTTENLSAGVHAYKLSGLKCGVYVAGVVTGDRVYTNKLISFNTTNTVFSIAGSNQATIFTDNIQRAKNISSSAVDMTFDPGDEFHFIGYGTGVATDTIRATPTHDEQYSFVFHTPNTKTVGEMIRDLPDSYSLYKSIMAGTLSDTLSTVNGAWFTAILQSDSCFASQNIFNSGDLMAKLKTTLPDYATDEKKLLLLFAQSHIINRLAYVVDLNCTEATLANNIVIPIRTNQDSVILNEFRTADTYEKGVSVNKQSEWTDKSCSNGVLLDVSGLILPAKRTPFPVFWEPTEQPEIKRLKEYRKAGATVAFLPGELSEISFGRYSTTTLAYTASAWDIKSQYIHGDYFVPNLLQWMEIKTPVLAQGDYKVWVCWRRAGNSEHSVTTTFKQSGQEDQVLSYTISFQDYFTNTRTTDENLLLGHKQYNAKYSSSVINSQLTGTIHVESTGRHTLNFDATYGSKIAGYLDMIQFIPVDQNQVWPRFDATGNAIYPCTPCEQIYPYDQSCSGDLCN